MEHFLVSARGLGAAYGDRTVFTGIDLEIVRGETVAVLGPSGCGKSTLLRVLAGLERPSAGALRATDEIGVVFQEPRLMPWLDVARNVAFAARTPAERARVDAVIDLVGLGTSARRLPKELSGGMAQRAALARTLVREPALLLLDEPLSALDALLRDELQRALARAIAVQRCGAVLVTHDVDEALFLADRVVVLAGLPATIRAVVHVPPAARRNRDADLTAERRCVLHALGAGTSRAAPAAASSLATIVRR